MTKSFERGRGLEAGRRETAKHLYGKLEISQIISHMRWAKLWSRSQRSGDEAKSPDPWNSLYSAQRCQTSRWQKVLKNRTDTKDYRQGAIVWDCLALCSWDRASRHRSSTKNAQQQSIIFRKSWRRGLKILIFIQKLSKIYINVTHHKLVGITNIILCLGSSWLY